ATASGEGTPRTIGVALTPLPPESAGGGRTPGRETAVALSTHRLVEKSLTDVEKQPVTLDDSAWAGFAAQYFMSVAMPADGAGQADDTAADGQAPGALQGRPGGPPEGDDGALPSASREPAVGLSSDGPPAADLRRPVQRIVARDRAAPRAVRPLDQRSLFP